MHLLEDEVQDEKTRTWILTMIDKGITERDIRLLKEWVDINFGQGKALRVWQSCEADYVYQPREIGFFPIDDAVTIDDISVLSGFHDDVSLFSDIDVEEDGIEEDSDEPQFTITIHKSRK